jgi:hypothetical protein
MTRAEVYVVDMPGPEMIVDGVDVHAIAMVDMMGSHPSAKLIAGSHLRVFLDAVNLLRTAGGLPGVESAIRDTLARELGQLLEELQGKSPGAAN